MQVAWSCSAGERENPDFATRREPRFSTTPIVVDGVMYFGTPLGRIIALAPDSGEELWVHDSGLDLSQAYSDFTNRGVATWLDSRAAPGAPCSRRIYMGLVDARLAAMDAADGKPCTDFGEQGYVDLRPGSADRAV